MVGMLTVSVIRRAAASNTPSTSRAAASSSLPRALNPPWQLGLFSLEMPTRPSTGIDLESLEEALFTWVWRRHRGGLPVWGAVAAEID